LIVSNLAKSHLGKFQDGGRLFSRTSRFPWSLDS
jgi:hypothetical protein